ncbi:hypothetical protein [Brevibacillus porteri]|uniref:hypothetical protein n=1 Tax=Brevibacillus porteri TaxID=2126350 RepID=UPI003628072A
MLKHITERLFVKRFPIATAVLLSTLLLTTSPQTLNAKRSEEVEITNASSYDISEKAINRIGDIENYEMIFNNLRKMSSISKNKSADVIFVDFEDKEQLTSFANDYKLAIGIEEVNDKESDVILYWVGKNKNGIKISGKDDIFVDIDAYKEEKKKDKALVIQDTILDAVTDHLEFLEEDDWHAEDTNENRMSLAAANGEYDWKSAAWDQVSKMSPPYGKIRLNYKISKAVSLDSADKGHYMSAYLNAQVNPGAQLAGSDDNYDVDSQVYGVELKAKPKDPSDTPYVMLDHEPVNTGNSGSTSHQGGLGFDMKGGGSFSYAYQFSQNWTDLDLTDNSDEFGKWTYEVLGDLQEEVVTVKGGAIFKTPTNYSSHTINVYADVTFDGPFISPATRIANERIKLKW